MAKKKVQSIIINLTCTVCQHRNYTTTKNKNNQEPLELNKFCPWCKRYTKHKEEGIKKKRKKK